jgi:hypothetical protein
VRHVIGSVIVWAAAAFVGWALPVPIQSSVFLLGLIATTAIASWVTMSGTWTFDRLKDYAQLPVPRRWFFGAFSVAVWLVLMCDTALPIVAFGVASRAIDVWTIVLCVAFSYATIAFYVAAYLLVHGKGWMGLPPVGVLALGGGTLVRLGGYVGAAVVVVLWTAVAWVEFVRSQRSYLARHRGGTARLGVNNYFLTVSLSQPTVLMNSVFLLVFAGVIGVMSASYGIPVPLAFAIFAVSSPVATLMSVDRDLRLHWRMLGQPKQLMAQYSRFCLLYFGVGNAVLFVVHVILHWPNPALIALIAVVCTLVEVLVVPLMEVKFPITGAKTSRDVWRNPRKYLLPSMLLILSLPLMLVH